MQKLDAAQTLALLGPAMARRDRKALNAIIARLIELRAPLGRQWQAMAMLANTHGESTLAREATKLWIQTNGDTPKDWFDLAAQEAIGGKLSEAKKILDRLPPDFPDPASRAHIEGTTALNMGDSDAAIPLLLRAIEHQPLSGPSWLSLSMAADMPAGSEIGDRVIAQEPRMAGVPDADKGAYYYALGKAYADRKDADNAFRAFDQGAKAIRRARPYDRAENEAGAREALKGATPEWFAAMRDRITIDTSRPIFVIGLPRSGTTLVEQIIVSHSTVFNGAEINRMAYVAKEVGGNSPAALDAYLKRGGDADEMAAYYLHLIDEYFGGEGRLVDKSLNHSRVLGLIAGLLSQAPLIWIRRDPLDCAWSCFRTYFLQGTAWGFDFADIAHNMKIEDALFERWTTMLGDRLLVVPYADLVAQPEPWIASILDHCGLTHEPGCFSPHETQRVVSTASVTQVRNPINRRGLGVADPYLDHMGAFIEAYFPDGKAPPRG